MTPRLLLTALGIVLAALVALAVNTRLLRVTDPPVEREHRISAVVRTVQATPAPVPTGAPPSEIPPPPTTRHEEEEQDD